MKILNKKNFIFAKISIVKSIWTIILYQIKYKEAVYILVIPISNLILIFFFKFKVLTET